MGLADRLKARQEKRAVDTSKKSGEKMTASNEPQTDVTTSSAETKAVEPSDKQDATASQSSAGIGRKTSLSAMMKAKAATAGSKKVDAKAAAAKARAAIDSRPSEQSVDDMLDAKPSDASRERLANAMAGAQSLLNEEQETEVRAIEGLDADMFMGDLVGLEEYLKADVPDIATLQHRTHQNLIQYPELVHILKDEQIHVIVEGLMKRKNIEITTPSSGRGGANVKGLTKGMSNKQVEDLL